MLVHSRCRRPFFSLLFQLNVSSFGVQDNSLSNVARYHHPLCLSFPPLSHTYIVAPSHLPPRSNVATPTTYFISITCFSIVSQISLSLIWLCVRIVFSSRCSCVPYTCLFLPPRLHSWRLLVAICNCERDMFFIGIL